MCVQCTLQHVQCRVCGACLCELTSGSLQCPTCLAADDPAMGAPVEYIDLRGTTRDKPATCKYTGNKYYSEVRCLMCEPVPPGDCKGSKLLNSINLLWVLTMVMFSLQDWMYPGKLSH